MAANPVVLVLGAGPRIGASVAKTFAGKGYKVVVASRSGTESKTDEGYLSLKVDFAKPDTIPALFDAVKAEFRTAPQVIVYNAASLTPPPDEASILSIPAASVTSDLNVNTVSPYVVAQQAIAGWETLPKETKKTFIYTGNILNTIIVPRPMMLNLGVGKSGSAYWIGAADAAYTAQGYRFFYADERQEDGKSMGLAVNGDAHGDFFVQLANHEGKVPWHATFVKGKGYVQFK